MLSLAVLFKMISLQGRKRYKNLRSYQKKKCYKWKTAKEKAQRKNDKKKCEG